KPSRPRSDVLERYISPDAMKVTFVPGHEHTTGLTTGQRQQDIIRERLRHAADFESLLSCHIRQKVARTVPGAGCGRKRPPGSLEDVENIAFEDLAISLLRHPGSKLLGDHNAEVLEWRERPMESLQRFVRHRVAERIDEDLRVEDVLARCRTHGSRSGDEI